MHRRAEMIPNDAVGACRNDVDFVCRISAAQPIRIAENFCRSENIEGAHWRNGNNQHPKRVPAHGTTVCSIAPHVSSCWRLHGHSQDWKAD